MDSPTQPTFIPHEAVTSPAFKRSSGGLPELIFLLSIIILIISGALAAGVFLYTQYLQTTNTSELNQLNSAEGSFDPSLITQLTTLDTRMNAAQTLLSAHLAPSQFFAMLQASTVQDVSFSSLTYSSTDPQNITITMSGVAGSVNSIALQAQVFSQSGVITDPIFSDIDQEQDGVHFDFTALVNPSAITYEGLVTGSSPSAAQSQTATTSAQTPSAAQASLFEGTSAATSTTPAPSGTP